MLILLLHCDNILKTHVLTYYISSFILGTVMQARAIEGVFVARCRSQQVPPPSHPLVAGPETLTSFLRVLDDSARTDR